MSTPASPTTPSPDDLREVLMPLALVLLLVGILDGVMILYSGWAGHAYASNLYVFALLGAVVLARGSMFTVGIAIVAAAFFISAVVGMSAIVPLYMPNELVMAYIRFAPWPILGSLLRSGLILAMLIWAMKRLMHPVLVQAQVNEGMQVSDYWKRPAIGFVLGFAVPMVNGLSFAAMQASEIGRQAVTVAQKQLAPGEKAYLNNILPGSASDARGSVEAQFVAYKPDGLRLMNVTWQPTRPQSSDAAARTVPATKP